MNDDDSGEFEAWDFPMPLLVTSGDPAGIGPEVVHRAVRRLQKRHEILAERPVAVIGDAFLYARHLAKPTSMHAYHIIPVDDFIHDPMFMLEHIEPPPGKPWRPIFLDCGFKDERAIKPGKPTGATGERAGTYLGAAVEMLAADISDAVVTGPICKEVMDDGDFPFPGQTEMFAQACKVKHPVMMLVGGGLRVALATIHEPLSRVPKLITRKHLRGVLETTRAALVNDFGIEAPRIAVCGLNPHAGENGKFGTEDRKVIRPLVEDLQKKGWIIEGPLAADSVFAHARAGRYDAVLAMYHDQGLIPVKTLAFYEGVNVTLGLPIVRTAPDHGTACDIAGQGKANAGAMHEALKLAHTMSNRRSKVYA
ncbi:MAG: 4-hydroxythreonine-4-phosphate dehydrogenase PdxA [Planctomycetes bacterium]|nr:4-hydroxythreonine-4-phosphate dehydrogenase PdxA [Planctomycetota bacterium]MCW8134947.1 4-hydroxythreonine-4-phosphate dehydrogenase PdxA [Planctomycetota bacterium]